MKKIVYIVQDQVAVGWGRGWGGKETTCTSLKEAKKEVRKRGGKCGRPCRILKRTTSIIEEKTVFYSKPWS